MTNKYFSLSLSQLSPHINRSHPFSRFAFFIIGKDHLKFSKHDFISFRANIDTRNIRGIIIEFRLFESDSSLPFSIEREREETKRGKEDRLKTRSLNYEEKDENPGWLIWKRPIVSSEYNRVLSVVNARCDKKYFGQALEEICTNRCKKKVSEDE